MIQSFDFSNLKYIKGIDITENGYYLMLRTNNGDNFSKNIEEKDLPRNQEMLERLDKRYKAFAQL